MLTISSTDIRMRLQRGENVGAIAPVGGLDLY